jgi:hypothetical protein
MGMEVEVPNPVLARLLPEIRVLVPGVRLLPRVCEVPKRLLPVVCAKVLGIPAITPKSMTNPRTAVAKSLDRFMTITP